MKIRTLFVLPLLLSFAACGGESDAEAAPAPEAEASAAAVDCPPLTVTLDGTEVEGLDHALAYSEPANGWGPGGFGVDVFNHDQATCDDLLATSRDVPEGEIAVRAFVKKGESSGSVAVGSKTNFAQGVELLQTAENVGERVAICVSEARWTTGGFGDSAGKTYVIDGLFTGEYCGERTR